MRVIERSSGREDEHFTEGEPDLEPPEELAVAEVDEEAILEEELDNEDLLEDEVAEDVLENSLEHLIHDGDDVEDVPDLEVADLEVADLEDRDESLDRILREKLAGDEEPGDDLVELVVAVVEGRNGAAVSACGPDEFVCRSCFLVRSRTQWVETAGGLCRDCSG